MEVSEDEAQLFYASSTGGVFGVEASPNLADWTAIATNTIGPSNAFEIVHPTAPAQFYRLFLP